MKSHFRNYFVFLILLSSVLVLSETTEGESLNGNTITSNSYTTHAIINIDGNAQLMSTATAENWDLAGTRDGSASAPFVITGNNITQNTAILVNISNTDLHVEIKGNYLNGQIYGGIGIALSNTSNINIEDNFILNLSNAGIYAEYSSLAIVINNTINSVNFGVHFSSVSNPNVSRNTIFDNSLYGIFTYMSLMGTLMRTI